MKVFFSFIFLIILEIALCEYKNDSPRPRHSAPNFKAKAVIDDKVFSMAYCCYINHD
jgi:hypothetical protein